MKQKPIATAAAAGLLVGCVLGMAGSVVPSDTFRNMAWAIDSAGLILAGALLTVYYFRKGYDLVAAGFIVFVIGQSIVFSSCATSLDDHIPSFGVGMFLWAVSIAVISSQKLFPVVVRGTGMIAALLFAIVAVRIFAGESLNALVKPLPFFAYPFYAATLVGWAWTLLKKHSLSLNS